MPGSFAGTAETWTFLTPSTADVEVVVAACSTAWVSTLSSVVDGVRGGINWISIDCCWLCVCVGHVESTLVFLSGVVARVGTLEARCNVNVVEIWKKKKSFLNLLSPHTSEVNLFTFLDKLVGVFCSDGVSDAKPELLLLENFFRFRFSAASAPKCK
jgi:hypothetical protein